MNRFDEMYQQPPLTGQLLQAATARALPADHKFVVDWQLGFHIGGLIDGQSATDAPAALPVRKHPVPPHDNGVTTWQSLPEDCPPFTL